MSENPPRAPSPLPTPHVAHVEDFDEAEQATVPETKKSANIAAKRSKAEGPKPKAYDFSDSGYSSHTAATLDSSLESKADPAAPNPATAVAPAPEESPGGEAPSQINLHHEKRSLLQRVNSRGRNEGRRERTCHCDKCRAIWQGGVAPIDNHRHSKSIDRSMGMTTRASLPAHQHGPVAAQASYDGRAYHERLRRPSGPQRPRPMSMHAGATPDTVYMAQAVAQPVFLERQPGSRQSMAYPYSSQTYQPVHPAYYASAIPAPPQPEMYIPLPTYGTHATSCLPSRSRQWVSEPLHPPPHSTLYSSSPVVDKPQLVSPQIAYASVVAKPPASSRRLSQGHRSQQSLEGHHIRRSDSKKMPPPPLPGPPKADVRYALEQRPGIRHAATTTGAYPQLYHRPSENDQRNESVNSRFLDNASHVDQGRSMRPVFVKPRKSSDEKMVSFESVDGIVSGKVDSNDNQRSHSRRRSSVYDGQSLREREASIEAYQALTGTIPRATSRRSEENMLPLVRKKPNSNSDSGSRTSVRSEASRHSKECKEGSDIRVRTSVDRRPDLGTKSRSSNENFAMRFSTSQDINFDLGRVADGRSINLRRIKDAVGDMELSIGSQPCVKTVGNRPAGREHSRKRYSLADDSGGVREIEAAATISRSRNAVNEQNEMEPERRVIGERIRTTVRSRRSSRYRYNEEVC